MREQTFQRLLKPHSCGASWRDKKLPAGGTQPKSSIGLQLEPLRPLQATFPEWLGKPLQKIYVCKRCVKGCAT